MSLLITREKWNKFSTLNKYFLIAAIFGVLFGLFTIYIYFFPKNSAPNFSDLVTKDDNPTKLEITDVTIKKWLRQEKPHPLPGN